MNEIAIWVLMILAASVILFILDNLPHRIAVGAVIGMAIPTTAIIGGYAVASF